MKESVTTAAAHRQYQDSVSAFHRSDPRPHPAHGVQPGGGRIFPAAVPWGSGRRTTPWGSPPGDVEFYNAIYSGTGPAPSALYWEVATGVADYDLFQPPAFFAALRTTTGGRGPHWPRRFTDQLTLLLLLFARGGRSGQRGGGGLCQRLLRYADGPVRAGRPQWRPPSSEG